MKHLSPCLIDYPYTDPFDKDLKALYDWANEDYEKNTFPFKGPEILAVDGTRVRSKSECILYNEFHGAALPFRNDLLLELKSPDPETDGMYVYVSPDFQFKCLDQSLIILEHGGMLSSKKYSEDLAWKIHVYSCNGYVLNVNLFITADSPDGGIDSMAIKQLIETLWWRILR